MDAILIILSVVFLQCTITSPQFDDCQTTKMDIPNFLQAFHNLEGTTLGEKRKGLSRLLNNTTKNIHLYNLETLISSITPTNALEETLKVYTIIHFKMVPEMMEILKTENWILISKILKQKFFYEELTVNYPPEFLMDLSNKLSFVVRTKLVNNLALNTTNTTFMDQLLELFINKYGVEHCTYLLTGCSPDKIRETVSKYNLNLNPPILLRMAKKDPDLIVFYADICKSNNSNNFNYNDDLVLGYLITNNFGAFLKIHEKHGNLTHCGKRTTCRLIKNKKELILNDAKRFEYFLNKKGIVKGLHSDFVEFYSKILPDKVEDIRKPFNEDKFYKYIRLLPKKTQLKILDGVFNKKWNTTFLKETLSPKLIEDFYGVNERIRFTKLLFAKVESGESSDNDENELIKYLDTKTALELLKKKISLTTELYEKRDLINMLVQTCSVNKDSGSLLEVCKYFISRHRNDDPTIKMWFLTEIMDNFQTETLSEEHWKYFGEIMCMITSTQKYYYDRHKFLLKNTIYCLTNSLPPNEYVREFCKTTNSYSFEAKPEVEKKGLLLFYDLIPEVFSEDTHRVDAYLKLFVSVINWNEKHPFDKINFNELPHLIEALHDETTTSLKGDILKHIICKGEEFFVKEHYIGMYFKLYKFIYNNKVNMWLLRNKPESIQQHIEIYSAHFYPNYEYYLCKKYPHLNIPQNLATNLVKLFEESTAETDCIRVLAILLSVDDFSKIASPYYPTELKVDLHSEEAQLKYNKQRAIASNLKYSQPPSSALGILLNFCCGDYLRSALESLYYLFYNTPEEKLGVIVENLSKRAVSVRKHTIFLTDKIFSKQRVVECFKWFVENEKDASIRKYLFKTLIKFFTQNPCDEIWEIVKMNIGFLHKNDEEAFDFVVDNKSIPEEYWGKYVQFTWTILKRNEENNSTLKHHKFTLIKNIPEHIFKTLDENFCDGIIREHFTEVQDFAKLYLIHSSVEHLKMRLNTVFGVIKELKEQSVKNVTEFVGDFCRKTITSDAKEVLVQFEQMWAKIFSETDDFCDYLCLQITLMHFNTASTTYVNSFGVNLAQFLDSLCIKYGISIVDVFMESLESVLWSCLDHTNNLEDSSKIEFVRSFYNATGSTATALIAIKSISELILDSDDVCYKSTIFQDLRNKTEPIVQVYCGKYLNDLIVY